MRDIRGLRLRSVLENILKKEIRDREGCEKANNKTNNNS